MSTRKHKNDRFKAIHGDTTRSAFAAAKKATKQVSKKFASDKTKARKLETKQIKREVYLAKHKNENRTTNK